MKRSDQCYFTLPFWDICCLPKSFAIPNEFEYPRIPTHDRIWMYVTVTSDTRGVMHPPRSRFCLFSSVQGYCLPQTEDRKPKDMQNFNKNAGVRMRAFRFGGCLHFGAIPWRFEAKSGENGQSEKINVWSAFMSRPRDVGYAKK